MDEGYVVVVPSQRMGPTPSLEPRGPSPAGMQPIQKRASTGEVLCYATFELVSLGACLEFTQRHSTEWLDGWLVMSVVRLRTLSAAAVRRAKGAFTAAVQRHVRSSLDPRFLSRLPRLLSHTARPCPKFVQSWQAACWLTRAFSSSSRTKESLVSWNSIVLVDPKYR